ncbi:hypothetical protein GCM10023149_21150 [Mucilaginibacter gynuensis]|uniref:Uncharacterized protein n=1 Tax=Mucilaginibacter gynuensis TaxID=1302236 RepID=A0ABP8GC54_9SPHI
MTTIVTALMYSGKPNPSWELTPEQAKNFKEILIEKQERTTEISALAAGLLGYTGFSIETFDDSLHTKTFCFDGLVDLVDQKQFNFIDRESSLESFLLETGKSSLSDTEATYISDEISKNFNGGIASKNKLFNESFNLFAVPPFNPGKWNIPSVQPFNNCYNYANDKITNTFAQPGRGSGSEITDVSCPTVSAAAQRDGQIAVSNASSTPEQGHFIALVSGYPTFNDYHWYRLDSNAMWSHKPGGTAARNTDNSGNLITDPRTCNRGPYTTFCGFFHCIPANTRIR